MTINELAKQFEAVMGTNAPKMHGDETITRAQAAAHLCRAMCLGPMPAMAEECKDANEMTAEEKNSVGMALYYQYLTCNEQGYFLPKEPLSDTDCEMMLRLAKPGRSGVRAFTKELVRLKQPLEVLERVYRLNNEADLNTFVKQDAASDTRCAMSFGASAQKLVWHSKVDVTRACTVLYAQEDNMQAFMQNTPPVHGATMETCENAYRLIAYVLDHDMLPEKQLNTVQFTTPPAVEELRFKLADVSLVDKWMQCDQDIWTEVLSRNEGFYGKEVWQSKQDPCLLKTVIYWRTRQDWLNFDHDLLAPVDAQMEKAMGEGNCTFYDAQHEQNEYYLSHGTL